MLTQIILNNYWIIQKKKYKTLLNVAVPAGMWQKMDEIICDDNDQF